MELRCIMEGDKRALILLCAHGAVATAPVKVLLKCTALHAQSKRRSCANSAVVSGDTLGIWRPLQGHQMAHPTNLSSTLACHLSSLCAHEQWLVSATSNPVCTERQVQMRVDAWDTSEVCWGGWQQISTPWSCIQCLLSIFDAHTCLYYHLNII